MSQSIECASYYEGRRNERVNRYEFEPKVQEYYKDWFDF